MAQSTVEHEGAAASPYTRGERYRPSNGTEGEIFFDGWCRRCAKDRAMREGIGEDECKPEELCELIAASMAFDPDEPGYPKEWVIGKNGWPTCTAFVRYVPAKRFPPIVRFVERTPDLFAK